MSLISLLTAEPGNGKTTVALRRLKTRSAIFFVPTPKNANAELSLLPWVFLKDLDHAHLAVLNRKNRPFRVVMADSEAERLADFIDPIWTGWAFVFDDFPQLFFSKPSRTQFDRFAAGIRHRDGQIIVTTQRILGVIPPFVRTCADEITQIGPLLEMTEARTLYYMGGSSRYAEFKAFYKAILLNPPYTEFRIK